jgi:hypothetical protein
MAALGPLHIACPVCQEEIVLPARLCIDPEEPVAQLLVDLGPSREHARSHQEILPASLAEFGVAW